MAAYPEIHLRASAQDDLRCFVEKVKAGAYRRNHPAFLQHGCLLSICRRCSCLGVDIRLFQASCPSQIMASWHAFQMPAAPRSPAGSDNRLIGYMATTWLDTSLRPIRITDLVDQLMTAGVPGPSFLIRESGQEPTPAITQALHLDGRTHLGFSDQPIETQIVRLCKSLSPGAQPSTPPPDLGGVPSGVSRWVRIVKALLAPRRWPA